MQIRDYRTVRRQGIIESARIAESEGDTCLELGKGRDEQVVTELCHFIPEGRISP